MCTSQDASLETKKKKKTAAKFIKPQDGGGLSSSQSVVSSSRRRPLQTLSSSSTSPVVAPNNDYDNINAKNEYNAFSSSAHSNNQRKEHNSPLQRSWARQRLRLVFSCLLLTGIVFVGVTTSTSLLYTKTSYTSSFYGQEEELPPPQSQQQQHQHRRVISYPKDLDELEQEERDAKKNRSPPPPPPPSRPTSNPRKVRTVRGQGQVVKASSTTTTTTKKKKHNQQQKQQTQKPAAGDDPTTNKNKKISPTLQQSVVKTPKKEEDPHLKKKKKEDPNLKTNKKNKNNKKEKEKVVVTTTTASPSSNFGSKPRMVAYMDYENVGTPKEVRDMLVSKYRAVIRVNPDTFNVTTTTTSNEGAETKTKNEKPLWTWFTGWADPMSETDPHPVGGIITPDKLHNLKEDFEPCQLPHQWMKQSFPTCNNIHEQSNMLEQMLDPNRLESRFLMGKGSMRSVWGLEQNVDYNAPIETAVLKTLNIDKSWDYDNMDRHRRDALVSERLTGSSHFLDVYGYCSQSAIYETASSGSLFDAIGAREYSDVPNDVKAHTKWESWSHKRKLDVAYQVVSAVTDLHDIDGDGRPSVVHDDLDITQFVSTDGGKTFKLSDFNGSPFLLWNNQWNETCPVHALMKGGKTRSPEEYNRDWITEKTDVFSMGNIIYTIVVGEYPYRELRTSAAEQQVMNGILPRIPDHIRKDSDPINQALLYAMQLCWKKDPNKRSSAAKVKKYLEGYIVEAEQKKKEKKKEEENNNAQKQQKQQKNLRNK